MEPANFSRPSGRVILRHSPATGKPYWAFVPASLPPELEQDAFAANAALLAEANRKLGQLDGIGQFLPNPDLLVQPYMRREAVLSSRIEGLHTTHAELATLEAMGELEAWSDTRDVHNYVVALDYGLRHVPEAGITRGLVLEMHRKLMQGARGEAFSTPGEFRTVQNHIGNTREHTDARFVPPPPDELHDCLDALFGYLAAAKPQTPALVEAAWLHYQFEAIHPFLDGNGRVGRALLPLLLAWRLQLSHPLLYLSPYFERDCGEYYDRLRAVSTLSEWSEWLRFFLRGVVEQADEGVALSRDVINLGADWRRRLDAHRAPRSAHRLADLVLQFMAVDAKMAERMLGVSTQTAYKAVATLVEARILEEITGRPWGRVYLAPELSAIFSR